MSSTLKLPSQAPLLISCPLPLVTPAQQPAGSFHERTASPFSFQQLCPPDFPMPDIRKRQCAGPIDLHAFAPVLAYHLLRLEQTPDLRSFPAEIVPGQLQKLAGIIAGTLASRRVIVSSSRNEMRAQCRYATLRVPSLLMLVFPRG